MKAIFLIPNGKADDSVELEIDFIPFVGMKVSHDDFFVVDSVTFDLDDSAWWVCCVSQKPKKKKK